MDVLIERCAGLDVHKKTVVACIRTPGAGPEERENTIHTFRTTMKGLESLRDWLDEGGVTHVVMESTGVYWYPVWTVLEERFKLMLVNARHVKKVPGRKTDVKDSEWLAQLLECGLLRGSFVPPRAFRDLRALTRTRKQLIRVELPRNGGHFEALVSNEEVSPWQEADGGTRLSSRRGWWSWSGRGEVQTAWRRSSSPRRRRSGAGWSRPTGMRGCARMV